VSEIDNFEAMPVTDGTAPEVTVSLGQRLREARQARGLGIDDVVHTLKFSARQIEAVEADQMDVLPSSVFQRGLVRSYARLLKLDPEPLLALIESQAPAQEPDIRAPENMGNAAPKGGLFRIPPLVAVSVLLLIAAGVMIGSHYFGIGTQRVASVAAQAVVAVVDAPTVAEVAKPEIQPAVSPVLAPKPEPVAGPVNQAGITPYAPAPDVSVPAPAVVVAPPPNDGRRLSFQFQGESWIEVKDASGLVILTGIYQSGIQSAAGRPPFEVVIGNAAVVALRDNGQPVDLKPYTRSEVARLTLK
jgi:cytoskeleton protein RodZ